MRKLLTPRSQRPGAARDKKKETPAWNRVVALPSTIKNVARKTPKADPVNTPYHWRPVQVRNHDVANESAYSVGTYVNTLAMHVNNKTFEGASSHLIRLEPNNFAARETLWCYLVGGMFVICKGVVVGICPKEHDPARGRNTRIGRLPANLRPKDTLKFAALSREAYDVGGHVAFSSHLVTLSVDCDGWIHGTASQEAEGAVDLSAIRFCVGGGISLVDEVSLHTVDVAGTRLVGLQGSLTERFHTIHRIKPLALLPESCRPPGDIPFVVAGASLGGFHLLIARPSYGLGCGGDIMWRDSVWNHDKINLTGIMYEISPDAFQFSTLSTKWSGEEMLVFVKDFQNFLIRKYGSIEEAWSRAFDTDGSGSVNFTEFGCGCKSSGFVGNATRLWAALDEDRSGEISLDELNTGIEQGEQPLQRNGAKKMTLLDLLKMGTAEDVTIIRAVNSQTLVLDKDPLDDGQHFESIMTTTSAGQDTGQHFESIMTATSGGQGQTDATSWTASFAQLPGMTSHTASSAQLPGMIGF